MAISKAARAICTSELNSNRKYSTNHKNPNHVASYLWPPGGHTHKYTCVHKCTKVIPRNQAHMSWYWAILS